MEKKNPSPITQRIYDYCKQNKISQTELARRINKTQSTISAWGQRGTEPPAELLEPIANALNVTLEWLITGTQKNYIILNEEEKMLLQKFNSCNKEGKRNVLLQVDMYSKMCPVNLSDSKTDTA